VVGLAIKFIDKCSALFGLDALVAGGADTDVRLLYITGLRRGIGTVAYPKFLAELGNSGRCCAGRCCVRRRA
jgi:hypothetical protein